MDLPLSPLLAAADAHTQDDNPYASFGLAHDVDKPIVPNWYYAAGLAGTALGAYHGYVRNNSIGWAIGWGLLGGLFPFITVPVALAQGFGKRA